MNRKNFKKPQISTLGHTRQANFVNWTFHRYMVVTEAARFCTLQLVQSSYLIPSHIQPFIFSLLKN